MSRGPLVYVTQRGKELDYSDLKRFGQPVFLTQRSIYPDETDVYVPVVMRAVADGMKNYLPALDYIALAADPAIIAIVVMNAIRSIGYRAGVIRLLKWDGAERSYYPIEVSLKELART